MIDWCRRVGRHVAAVGNVLAQEKYKHSRVLVSVVMLAMTLLAVLSMIDEMHIIASPWWHWAGVTIAVCSGLTVYLPWARPSSFVAIKFGHLLAMTILHTLASLLVYMMLSVPSVPDSAAFIATLAYPPLWIVSLRSSK